MKTILTINFLLISLIFVMPLVSDAQDLLNGPQKVVIDSERDRLLVSNFNTGDIVEIDSDGNETYFLQGAGFIDGLEIVGDVCVWCWKQ